MNMTPLERARHHAYINIEKEGYSYALFDCFRLDSVNFILFEMLHPQDNEG